MSNRNDLSALIIGPTDRTKIFRFGKLVESEFEFYKGEIGAVLASDLSSVYLIPDEGIPLEIAKVYKKSGGREVIGVLPKGGCAVLDKYLQFCDRTEEIDGGWCALNTCLSLKPGLMVGFGLSPGTLVEIAYSKYHRKYLGRNIPILLDERTISGRLNPEIEEELDVRYFSSVRDLGLLLKDLKRG